MDYANRDSEAVSIAVCSGPVSVESPAGPLAQHGASAPPFSHCVHVPITAANGPRTLAPDAQHPPVTAEPRTDPHPCGARHEGTAPHPCPNPNPKFLNRQGHPAYPGGTRLGTRDAKFNRAQNMTTDPNATAPGGVLGFWLWTQPLESLATRGGVLAVGGYFRIKSTSPVPSHLPPAQDPRSAPGWSGETAGCAHSSGPRISAGESPPLPPFHPP
jgi:hypothetical protein